MKNLFYVLGLVALVSCVSALAQEEIFRTQGHPREDIMARENMAVKSRQVVRDNYDPNFISFNQIKYWVGSGKDSAAVVIDWYLDGSETYVWGYLFDGQSTGIELLYTLAAEDPRFYMLVYAETEYGSAIGGMGVNPSSTGRKCITKTGYTPQCAGESGIISLGSYDFDGWSAITAGAYWSGGWMNGYWSYHTRNNSTSDFEYSQVGASSRIILPGSWDAWGYQEGWESWVGMLPRLPYVAIPQP